MSFSSAYGRVALSLLVSLSGCQQVASYSRVVSIIDSGVSEGWASLDASFGSRDTSDVVTDSSELDLPDSDAPPPPPDGGPLDKGAGCPLQLSPASLGLDVSLLDGTYKANCSAGTSCLIGVVEAFSYAPCATPSLQEVVEQALGGTQGRYPIIYADGTVQTRSDVLAQSGLGALLLFVEAKVGAPVVESWYFQIDVRCQNCTTWAFTLVLHIPAASAVVLVEGQYTWDS